MSQCANCGEGEAILFTCSHCDLQFCADHQFPHHACERFSRGGSAATGEAEEEAFVFGNSVAVVKPREGGTADPTEGPAGEAATGAAVAEETDTRPETGAETVTPEPVDPDATEPASTEPASTGSESTREPASDSRTVPGPRTEPVARDAARETRPDREGPSPEPPGRGMPWERGGGSPMDWMRQQSLPGFLLKVGALSLVFSLAYYAGLAAVMYGYV